jgi:glycine/serine hydroxymethyltransferase
MISLNTVVAEPTHPMSSSNTKDNNIFRLSNGNYISRQAYVYMVASENLISHKYLTPNESRWVFTNKVGN